MAATRRETDLVDGACPTCGHAPPDLVVSGDLEVDYSRSEARVHGEVVPLTPLEWGTLACLARHLGMPVPRAKILRAVWGYRSAGGPDEAHMVRSHVSRLRIKLEAAGSDSYVSCDRGRLGLDIPNVARRDVAHNRSHAVGARSAGCTAEEYALRRAAGQIWHSPTRTWRVAVED